MVIFAASLRKRQKLPFLKKWQFDTRPALLKKLVPVLKQNPFQKEKKAKPKVVHLRPYLVLTWLFHFLGKFNDMVTARLLLVLPRVLLPRLMRYLVLRHNLKPKLKLHRLLVVLLLLQQLPFPKKLVYRPLLKLLKKKPLSPWHSAQRAVKLYLGRPFTRPMPVGLR